LIQGGTVKLIANSNPQFFIEGEVCLNSVKKPLWQVNRSNGQSVSQKSSHCSTFFSQPHRQPLLFDAKDPLTSKNSPPILRPSKAMSYPIKKL
jgi:hypothetical protein